MLLKSKFDQGKFIVLAEMDPPKGADISAMAENAAKVKGKADAFVVPEMNSAVMRMSALGAAMVLQSKGMETVMQVCCRDRNRLALQADLLGAAACGIRSLMAVKGEDPRFGDHHQAKAVYDIDRLELLQAVRMLQQGRDMAGIELAGAPVFDAVGSTVNAGAEGAVLEAELEKMHSHIAAGATFFVTPPVFDIGAIAPFLKKADRKKVIPTVLLLKSVGMARYIDRNVPNVRIPAPMISRIQKAGDKVRECMTIAGEIIQTLKNEGFAGVMVSTLGWEQKLPELLRSEK
ncbi:MAG: 5,10-methylenetetrahydrofolate reductase [Desulfobacteraceae bacterium IS3]|nr:MAG: 5,10-methylenetetrahydrofolate reductase [Desulfobacteraceae bacterium IS3]